MRISQPETGAAQTAAAAPPAPCAADRLTVYFNGSCPLCSVEIDHYASRPGGETLDFVDVSRAGSEPGPGHSADRAMARLHVRLPDGRLASGARAFVAIWRRLPGWRWAARIARLPGVTPMLEGMYRAFLPVRPALSKLATRLGAKAAHPRCQER